MNSISTNNYVWPFLPNYDLIEINNFVIEFDKIKDFIIDFNAQKNIAELIKLTNLVNTNSIKPNQTSTVSDNDSFDDYIRLEAPFNIPCAYSEQGCTKKAAFKKSDKSYTCWFHLYCTESTK